MVPSGARPAAGAVVGPVGEDPAIASSGPEAASSASSDVASSVVGAAERTTPSCVGSDDEKQPLTSTLYVRVTPSPVGEEGPAGSKRAEHVDGRG